MREPTPPARTRFQDDEHELLRLKVLVEQRTRLLAGVSVPGLRGPIVVDFPDTIEGLRRRAEDLEARLEKALGNRLGRRLLDLVEALEVPEFRLAILDRQIKDMEQSEDGATYPLISPEDRHAYSKVIARCVWYEGPVEIEQLKALYAYVYADGQRRLGKSPTGNRNGGGLVGKELALEALAVAFGLVTAGRDGSSKVPGRHLAIEVANIRKKRDAALGRGSSGPS